MNKNIFLNDIKDNLTMMKKMITSKNVDEEELLKYLEIKFFQLGESIEKERENYK